MANEPDSGSTPVKLAMKKLMYKSPLSGIRSTPYKPPVDKSGFKPIGVSSPKLSNDGEGRDRFALVVEGPQQGRPRPLNVENERTPNYGVDSKPSPTGDSSIIHPSLGGRGGHWRGPQENNMSPDTRRGGKYRRHGYNSSPATEGIGQWYSPVKNVNDCSNNDSFGRNSFQQNFRNNSSFGSNPHTPNSPRGQFNSSDRSRNSPRNNRRGGGGNRGGHRQAGDISAFYSSSMSADPWCDLMRDKLNASSFRSRTAEGGGSVLDVDLSSDDADEGIASQENGGTESS